MKIRKLQSSHYRNVSIHVSPRNWSRITLWEPLVQRFPCNSPALHSVAGIHSHSCFHNCTERHTSL